MRKASKLEEKENMQRKKLQNNTMKLSCLRGVCQSALLTHQSPFPRAVAGVRSAPISLLFISFEKQCSFIIITIGSIFKDLFLHFICACVLYMLHVLRAHEGQSHALELALYTVLGSETKLRSSGRASGPLNHQAISPAST